MSHHATCPICGQYVTNKGDTIYRGGLIPRHYKPNERGFCTVAFGTIAKDGPELMSCTWTPKPNQKHRDSRYWVATVETVADGKVFVSAFHPKHGTEEAEHTLGEWWMFCIEEPGDKVVPTFDYHKNTMLVVDGKGHSFIVNDEYEAGSLAFSLWRGDAALWGK